MLLWFKRHFVLSSLLVVAILLALVVALSSQIAILFMRSYLSDYADDIAIEKLVINWWGSELRLNGLVIRNQDGQQLNINELIIDWDMTDLWDNNLQVNNFRLDGLQLDIVTEQFIPKFVGPIPIPAPKTEPEPSAGQGTPWIVAINDFEFRDVTICLKDSELSYSDFDLPLNDNKSVDHCFTLGSLEFDGPLTLNREQQLSFNDNLLVRGIELIEKGSNTLTKVDALAISPFVFSSDSVQLNELIIDGVQLFSNSEVDISDNGLSIGQITVTQVDMQMTTGDIVINQPSVKNVTVYGRASDQQIHELLHLDSMALQLVAQQQSNLIVDNLELSGLSLLEHIATSDEQYFINISSILVADLVQTTADVKVGLIAVKGLALAATLTEQGLDLAQWFPANESAEISEDMPSEAKSEGISSSMKIQLAGFQLDEQSSLVFVDQTLKNPISHQFNDINFRLGNLTIAPISEDSQVVPPKTDFEYQLTYGEAGKISGAGELSVSGRLSSLNLTGLVDRADLVNLSDYASRFIGYRIDSGLLDIKYQLALDNDQLDIELDTLLEKFELGNLQDHEKHELNEELGIPLPLALDLLRDSDNNIELDLPIKGSVDDPQFSVADVISTVAAKAIKNAVIYNYSPLGMLSMASGIIDLATALRFEPVAFEAAEVVLDDKDRAQLDKIAQTLLNKPRITMLICAQATQLDLIQPVSEENTANAQQMAPALTTEQTNQLLEIARSRQQLVIDYLVTKQGVARERLLNCNVKIATNKSAKPVVKISI